MSAEATGSQHSSDQPCANDADRAVADLEHRKAELREREILAARLQHAKGRRTARERIGMLLDPGSFTETGAMVRHHSRTPGLVRDRPFGDSVVTGFGTVDGRHVCLFAQDFTVFGGSLGEAAGEKIVKVMDLASEAGCPVIGINDSAGGRIQEGVVAQSLYGQIFLRNVRLSGRVPQISLIMGPCAGGAVYSPALTDFIVMTEEISHMFITGPAVIKAAMGEEVDLERLGGAYTHNTRSGNAHYLAADEEDAINFTRRLLSFLPSHSEAEPPASNPDNNLTQVPDRFLDSLMPHVAAELYDMHEVVTRILDSGTFLEIQRLFAPSVMVGFGRVEGYSVGVVANQPNSSAGYLDNNSCEKTARFIRTCDAFNIPVLTFVDLPGFRPEVDQARSGAIRRGAKLAYAYAEATTPLITIITGRAFGDGYTVMGSKHLGADINLAWPTAMIGTVDAAEAFRALHSPPSSRWRETATQHCSPYIAAERGYIDMVIRPSDTRTHIIRALRLLRSASQPALPPRKHDNIPL
ncbi:putative propionyl-CoA carboxylase beta chain 5 (plasmid) [Streptomyces sp. YIM 121038]|uniref:acyl-CoA carboxylase subunit beta n=1 Tax=Streptomyces sp. YIM 121038 TaxID=2136401 RepID=UPI0011104BEA|nr:acyl-CoA carboxylase subunit beta [Streptomyces sp. YIM 121038]QCX82584.1 putative propionyl-CoA carboxylase beta chain 5 [Streptomyces sp. YIM 121038]